jgi:hypothetical protein
MELGVHAGPEAKIHRDKKPKPEKLKSSPKDTKP